MGRSFEIGFGEGIVLGIFLKIGIDISVFGIGAVVIGALPLEMLDPFNLLVIRFVLIFFPVVAMLGLFTQMKDDLLMIGGFVIGLLLMLFF